MAFFPIWVINVPYDLSIFNQSAIMARAKERISLCPGIWTVHILCRCITIPAGIKEVVYTTNLHNMRAFDANRFKTFLLSQELNRVFNQLAPIKIYFSNINAMQ